MDRIKSWLIEYDTAVWFIIGAIVVLILIAGALP
jgi:hypothetical protein